MKKEMKNFTLLGMKIRDIAIREYGSLPKLAKELGIAYSNLYAYCTTKKEFPMSILEKVIERYAKDEEEELYIRIAFCQSERVVIPKFDYTFNQAETLYYLAQNLNKLSDEKCALINYVIGKKD